jgi:flagellin-like hook-associated protein FlgL
VALANITEITDRIKNAIVGTNGSNLSTSNLGQVVSDLLASLGGELNASFNGQYIFSGSDTITQPVPSTNVTNTSIGLPDDNYYVGSKQDATLRADERTEIVFPVRADDAAFQKIYAAARQAINAAKTGDASQLGAAQQLIQDGQRDLVTVRSRVGHGRQYRKY